MKVSKLTASLRFHLAEEFLEDHPIYKRAGITAKEVLKTYSCKVESRGNEFDDGFNPVEYDLIHERMGDQAVSKNGESVLWAVLADAFDSWLTNVFSNIGKE